MNKERKDSPTKKRIHGNENVPSFAYELATLNNFFCYKSNELKCVRPHLIKEITVTKFD
jgi:hypothetical protein